MIQNKTKVLNLKTRKTHVPINYLTPIITFHSLVGGVLGC
jgi:hypothetical protein